MPTLSFSSAWSITAAVNPPRAVYLDFPLGHTAGKPEAPDTNRAILDAALDAFTNMRTPGAIVRLPFEWADDDAWKDSVMRPKASGGAHADDRVERWSTPQYQTDEDRQRVAAAPDCPTCVFLE